MSDHHQRGGNGATAGDGSDNPWPHGYAPQHGPQGHGSHDYGPHDYGPHGYGSHGYGPQGQVPPWAHGPLPFWGPPPGWAPPPGWTPEPGWTAPPWAYGPPPGWAPGPTGAAAGQHGATGGPQHPLDQLLGGHAAAQALGAHGLGGLLRDDFTRGMLIGAAATFLLTNPRLQGNAISLVVQLWHMLQGGFAEMKERFHDAEADLHGDDDGPETGNSGGTSG